MTKDQRKERGFDKDRTITIALSVVVALVLWSYVMIQINPTKQETIYRVPVNLLNEQTLTEKELAILGDGQFTVDVIVEGKRSVISGLKEDVNAEVQLFGWGKGENYITVDVRVPSELKILQVKPDKIKVNIEDRVIISKPVKVVFEGNFPPDTEESEIITRPLEIEIQGARTAVESVQDVVVKINTNDLSPAGSQITREVSPLNKDGILVDHVKLSASHVSVSGKLLYKKEVALRSSYTGEAGAGQGVLFEAPETIIIKGDKDKIALIEEIETKPVELADYPVGGSMQLTPILPDGIEISKDNKSLTARLVIVETASLEVTLSGEDLIGQKLKPDLTLRIQQNQISLELIGEKGFIDNLSLDRVRFYVDADGLDPGEYILPLIVEVGGVQNLLLPQPAEVVVIIENISQENLIE